MSCEQVKFGNFPARPSFSVCVRVTAVRRNERTAPGAGGAADTDFTVQGKPASRVLLCVWTLGCDKRRAVQNLYQSPVIRAFSSKALRPV